MQQGGFGGQPPGGQFPGGFPGGQAPGGQPQGGPMAAQQPGAAPGWPVQGAPGQFPGAAGQPYAPGFPEAAQVAQLQAAQLQAAQLQAAQLQAGYPGAQFMGGVNAAQGQFPQQPMQGAPMQGAPMQGAPMQAAQLQAAQLQAAQMQAAQLQAAQMQAGFGAPTAPRPAFGHAQKALAGAGSSMKVMKYAFLTAGVLAVIVGIIVLITVDMMTGIIVAASGAVFAVVPLLILPQFDGMLKGATAMVDGFAAKERLAQTGIPAQGRLLSVQQTGRMVNMNPEIQALVEVHHPQLGVYQTQTTALVPQIAIPRAQPGSPVQLRVDPQNQQEIALVF